MKTLRITTAIVIISLLVILLAACGQQEDTPAGVGEGDDLVVVPLPLDRPEMAVPSADGVLPCGIGNVEWGYHVFNINDFTQCDPFFPNLIVACLDANAQWSGENLTIVKYTEADETITVDFQQAGLCALFPTD